MAGRREQFGDFVRLVEARANKCACRGKHAFELVAQPDEICDQRRDLARRCDADMRGLQPRRVGSLDAEQRYFCGPFVIGRPVLLSIVAGEPAKRAMNVCGIEY